jgi:2-polyprenyl-3-methyl-5-hydroxy-6-metoxy-1,4-benzoquinol methylase
MYDLRKGLNRLMEKLYGGKMILKYGKKIDFRKQGRDIRWIEVTALENTEISKKASKKASIHVNSCPICKSTNITPLKEINYFFWNRCENCGHFFVSNVPSEVSDIYEEGNQAQKTVYISEELFVKRKELISKPKAEFINSVIKQLNDRNNGLWVEIGCGVGELLSEVSLLGWETIGFEADPNEVEFARKHGINVVQIYVRDSFDKEVSDSLKKADVISIINVLEHIVDPLKWITNIISFMKKGSYLVIEVPRETSITAFCNLAGLPYKHLVTAGHYHIFSEKSMQIIQNHCKLENIAKWCFGNGFVDLLNTILWLSNAQVDAHLLDNILDKANDIQQKIDECGLSEAMLLVYRV